LLDLIALPPLLDLAALPPLLDFVALPPLLDLATPELLPLLDLTAAPRAPFCEVLGVSSTTRINPSLVPG
jgi:hypothetical protein